MKPSENQFEGLDPKSAENLKRKVNKSMLSNPVFLKNLMEDAPGADRTEHVKVHKIRVQLDKDDFSKHPTLAPIYTPPPLFLKKKTD